MRAIVLAAGRGERLMPLTADRPKSLVDLGGGRTVFDEQVEAMRASGGISRIVFVVGYRAEMIEERAAAMARGRVDVDTIYNPFFTVSNNLASLWLARGEMDQDFLVTNGDNLFTADVYTGLIARARPGITLAICPKDRFDSDDMKVVLHGDAVAAIGKALDRLVRRPEALHQFWLEVFNALAAGGVAVGHWTFESAGRWQEIDFHTDMSRATDIVRAKADSLRRAPARRTA